MSDYNIEDNLVQALTRAVDEGIRIGADLAAMHGSDATSQELEKAFFDGCEVGYKKALEELQPYIDLYKDLAEKAEKVAREVIDKYPKWIPVRERLPDYDEEVLVADFYSLGWCMHVWHRTHDGKGTDYWEAEDGHFVSINYTEYWMSRPEPPYHIDRPTDLVNTLKCLNCQQDCQMIGCDMDACSSYKPPKESEKDG